eukprot:TRINITY_DN6967_c0_g1_i1.p1 TRINITY_DN6967_c0_g1~~TRINITY_DN6967_c0_g1_i1.p1  ORF type:complete len:492 (+),score=96.37 TRINITY_DN6967_c0_g1_i1:125-1600(+)
MTGLHFADVGFKQRVIGNKVVSQPYDPLQDDRDCDKMTWRRGGGEKATDSVFVLIQPDVALDLSPTDCQIRSYIQMFKKTEELVEVLQTQSAEQLQELMGIKQKLAKSHCQRFEKFAKLPPKQACLLFGGHLRAGELGDGDRKFMQKHLRIISGLYGVLRPYDDVRPVRDLPMSGKLVTKRGKTVQEFWGDSISKHLAKEIASVATHGRLLLVACVSEDFWDTIMAEPMPASVCVLHCLFEGVKDERIRQGCQRLARFIIRERVVNLNHLKEFDDDDWVLDTRKSSDSRLVFRWRGEASDVKKSKHKSREKSRGSSSASNRSRKAAKSLEDRGRASASCSASRKNDDRDASSNSSRVLVAPKQRDDRDVRESSRSIARGRRKEREKEKKGKEKKKEKEQREKKQKGGRRRSTSSQDGGSSEYSNAKRRSRSRSGRRRGGGGGGGRRGRTGCASSESDGSRSDALPDRRRQRNRGAAGTSSRARRCRSRSRS